MGIFQQFPYSNFHEMNLDQIIKIMREMQDEWTNTKAEWASYKDFIDNYFANLNLDEETEKALRALIADGTLDPVIDPVIIAETQAWLADHITQPTTPAIDTSLTIAGAAADAKAAGDAIDDLKYDIDLISEVTRNLFWGDFSNGNIDSNGIEYSQLNYLRCNEFIPVDPSTVYTIHVWTGNSSFTQVILVEYAADLTVDTRRVIVASTPELTDRVQTFTTGANTRFIRFILYDVNNISTDGNSAQIETGSTATDYIQHLTAYDIYARDGVDYAIESIEGQHCFHTSGRLDSIFTNVQAIGTGYYAFGNIRNNYNGVTGFVLFACDSAGTNGVQIANVIGLPTSGKIVVALEDLKLSCDYDFSSITSGSRIIGDGYEFLIKESRFLNVLTDPENEFSVKLDGTGDFTTLIDAFNYAATIANSKNWVNIYVYPGTYLINNYYSAADWAVEAPTFIGLSVPDYCRVIGVGNKENIIIKGSDATPRQYISTLNLQNSCHLENLTVVSDGLRYAIHDDYGNNNIKGNRTIVNCVFDQSNGYYEQAYGAGVSDRDSVKMSSCIFDTDVAAGFSISFHNNTSFVDGASLTFENCRFNQKGINFITIANGANNEVILKGNKADYLVLNRQTSDTGIEFTVSGYANDINNMSVSIGNVSDYIDLI